MIMHFLGGVWVGLASLYIFQPQELFFGSIIKLLLVVLLVGVGWEVYEVFVNEVIAQNSLDFLDITSDVFFDLSGGLCAILYLYLLVPLKNQRNNSKD